MAPFNTSTTIPTRTGATTSTRPLSSSGTVTTITTDNDARAAPALHLPHNPTSPRPDALRCSTDPSPTTALLRSYFNTTTPLKSSSPHRNRSPYSRSHLRTRSSGAALVSAPVMTRAHSSPGPLVDLAHSTSAVSLSPSTPMRTPARQRSPFRPTEDSNGNPVRPRSPRWREPASSGAIESIQEDSELDITPRQPLAQFSPLPAPFARSSSLRRRPASPLHSVLNAAAPPPTSAPYDTSNTSSVPGSPSLAPQRFNEAYPPLHHYASSSSFSSIPSTPTSQRSRSPSISSLETIEDAPDLESEATEAERILRLKLAAERAERIENGEEDEGGRRRSSLDVPRGFGFTRGGSRERKRWSVCGGERRADLDLETIWED